MSPWPHAYLDQPITLIRAINLALLVAWLLKTHRLGRLGAARDPGRDALRTACRACRSIAPPRAACRRWGRCVRGEDPVEKPPGCGNQFGRLIGPGEWYRWEDYRPLLAYIRESTPPGTRVANLLWNVPYPPVNGPAGRLTPFPAAGGYIHLWMVDPSLPRSTSRCWSRTPTSSWSGGQGR